jgi:hypothetical protein
MDFGLWRLTHPLPQVVLTVSNSDFSTFEARLAYAVYTSFDI